MHKESAKKTNAKTGVAGLHMRGERVAIPSAVSAEHADVVTLLESCWAEDADKRPAAEALVAQLEKLVVARDAGVE